LRDDLFNPEGGRDRLPAKSNEVSRFSGSEEVAVHKTAGLAVAMQIASPREKAVWEATCATESLSGEVAPAKYTEPEMRNLPSASRSTLAPMGVLASLSEVDSIRS